MRYGRGGEEDQQESIRQFEQEEKRR